MARDRAETDRFPLSPITTLHTEPTAEEAERLLDRVAQWLADVAEDPEHD